MENVLEQPTASADVGHPDHGSRRRSYHPTRHRTAHRTRPHTPWSHDAHNIRSCIHSLHLLPCLHAGMLAHTSHPRDICMCMPPTPLAARMPAPLSALASPRRLRSARLQAVSSQSWPSTIEAREGARGRARRFFRFDNFFFPNPPFSSSSFSFLFFVTHFFSSAPDATPS